MTILSENLRILHHESGLTFEELSDKTGIAVEVLKAFESAKLEPDDFQLEILCRILKMPFEDIKERNLAEERRMATVHMKSGKTRETFNWYFGNRRIFWLYLGYIIFFVAYISGMVLYYSYRYQDISFPELYALYRTTDDSLSYFGYTFYYIYLDASIPISIFGFGVAAFISIDYLRRHQFRIYWWMIFFAGSIIVFVRTIGLFASIPYLIICIINLIKGKY